MDIEQYFNQIQEYIKQNIDDKNNINHLLKTIKANNIQAIINQNFNNKIDFKETGDQILDILNNKNDFKDDHNADVLKGERDMNTLEKQNFKHLKTFNRFKI